MWFRALGGPVRSEGFLVCNHFPRGARREVLFCSGYGSGGVVFRIAKVRSAEVADTSIDNEPSFEMNA